MRSSKYLCDQSHQTVAVNEVDFIVSPIDNLAALNHCNILLLTFVDIMHCIRWSYDCCPRWTLRINEWR